MAMGRLAPGGVLYFSNNFRKFILDENLEARYAVEEITASTIKKTEGWLGLWTLFYWAWWISWAPFVGMFIAPQYPCGCAATGGGRI